MGRSEACMPTRREQAFCACSVARQPLENKVFLGVAPAGEKYDSVDLLWCASCSAGAPVGH